MATPRTSRVAGATRLDPPPASSGDRVLTHDAFLDACRDQNRFGRALPTTPGGSGHTVTLGISCSRSADRPHHRPRSPTEGVPATDRTRSNGTTGRPVASDRTRCAPTIPQRRRRRRRRVRRSGCSRRLSIHPDPFPPIGRIHGTTSLPLFGPAPCRRGGSDLALGGCAPRRRSPPLRLPPWLVVVSGTGGAFTGGSPSSLVPPGSAPVSRRRRVVSTRSGGRHEAGNTIDIENLRRVAAPGRSRAALGDAPARYPRAHLLRYPAGSDRRRRAQAQTHHPATVVLHAADGFAYREFTC